jgi:cytochrome c-type biogenesis protein CcmH
VLLVVALAGMTLIVLGMVLGPLLIRTRTPIERAAFDRAVYRDQLAELERDVARGVIEPSEAASARLELQRRLLATDTAPTPIAHSASGAPQVALAAGLAMIVVVVAGAFYWRMGAPDLPDLPYAARGAERAQAAAAQAQMVQIRAMVAKLAEDMKSHPDDLDGWLRLARSYAVLGQPDAAVAAFAEAERLKPDDPAILLAEAQMLMEGHPVSEPISDQAVALLKRVVALDPDNPAASWYLGIYAAQQGDFAGARAIWDKLLAALPADSEEYRTVAAALQAISSR